LIDIFVFDRENLHALFDVSNDQGGFGKLVARGVVDIVIFGGKNKFVVV